MQKFSALQHLLKQHPDGKRHRARQGSNLKPLAPEANALSIELRAHWEEL